ncbi:MAG TPA: ribose-phosphate diphosphokinase [Polyangiaceae bacterium]|jgi:ribose-phosphate pyrophosphokinase|nr:MAG: Ribose-phosphate pyrophosphokinase [Deltaproteobacteria bacterium ADurb.Bin207]HNS99700.1 ribose-phosphate diphosphokinase [Polyangiaceae bacterium]HNZ22208.1 ribose-phosphate diphosphokinase [Polyangiaceae bacterium]HOD22277.1 ribose-phosphate diphosphokinase [Polyangiaceae bacterium]HOE47032.1 ribose-phosphate diphosphokinase [Polyangiaceae bacterium]
MVPAPLVFSTNSYGYLRDEICKLGRLERGQVERRTFPDGEHYQRICESVSGRDVVLVGGTIDDGATLELFDLASTLVKYGADRLTLVIPYFGYSTMERAVRAGEVVTAKTRARLFSAIPPASRGNRVFLLDLHTEGITHYFEGAITPRHISGRKVIAAAAREIGGEDFVLACTDAGRAKWVESLANDLGVHAAFVFKRRLDETRTEVTAVSAQVRGKNVVIYDDMIRTGGSLIHAARAYADAGAARLDAITTHGLFPADALEKLRSCGLLQRVVSTNSHPNACRLQDDFLQVISVADILVDELRAP